MTAPAPGPRPEITDEQARLLVVTARPLRSSRISIAVSIVIIVVFGVTALVMPRDNAGVHFFWKDQLGTAFIGLIIGGTALLPTRPRLRADINGIHARAFLGSPRMIPWNLVKTVEFPRKLRFARVVLPADETLALYAVQRLDREHSVEVMHGLRALYRATHPAPGAVRTDDVGSTG
jgi:hypothetical protein